MNGLWLVSSAGIRGSLVVLMFNWLHTYMAICPCKQDYCDTCAKFNAEVHAKHTTLSRIRQSGSASVEDQQQLILGNR